MRKFFILCGALVCFAYTCSAQDATAAFDASAAAAEPAAPAPASFVPVDREPWQLGVQGQYMQFNVLGTKFHDWGYQADITRYLNNWFGLEGNAIAGFGNAPGSPPISAKSFFIGAGPHMIIHSGHHLEPWAHVIVGWERFRFTQSSILGTNAHAAFIAGAGLDYRFGESRLAWRVQGDFIGTNNGTQVKADYSFGTGFVLNF